MDSHRASGAENSQYFGRGGTALFSPSCRRPALQGTKFMCEPPIIVAMGVCFTPLPYLA